MLSTMSLKFRLFSFLSRNNSKPTVTVTASNGPRCVVLLVVTHVARVWRLSASVIRLSVCLSVCLSVSMIKPKQLKLKSPNWQRDSPSRVTSPRPTINIRSKVKDQGHRVTKCKKAMEWLAWVMHSIECPALDGDIALVLNTSAVWLYCCCY